MKKVCTWILAVSLFITALPMRGITFAAEAEEPAHTTPSLTEKEPAVELVPENTLVWSSDSPILRHIDAQVLESGIHVARLPEEESLNSYVFRNQDGSATAYILDEPVKFIDGSGVIHEKDLTLMAVTGGYTTARNDVALTLPDNPVSGIGLQYKDSDILLIPQGGALRSMPDISDNSVTYANYFGTGISLRYTPTLSGVKEDIILSSYTGVNQFSFLLNTGGMGLFEEDGRYYIAQTADADERIVLGDIVAFDSQGRFHIGTTTVETMAERQSYRLTITVDEAFLTDISTSYPVIIDPTLTVNYDVYGANAIEDASIYSGYPTTNGDWIYLHAGYYDSNYKIARTLVRLPGLLRSSVYGDPDEFNITSVKFHIREATGTAAITVNIRANTGSSEWVESSVTWNNSGLVLGSQYATASPKYNSDTVYDITSLVKAWQKGTLNAASGFILQSSNEASADKAFYGAEYSATSYRPYVEVNYTYSSGSLNATAVAINEGDTRTLSVSGLSGTVTWSSSNSAVATVSSSGVVTGIKAGTATITAIAANYTPLTCTVYVTKPDGVYRIKNNAANYYIGTSGSIAERTYTQLVFKTSAGPAQLYQLWKITHLGAGHYSIRPLYKPDMAMFVNLNHATLYTTGTSDSIDDISTTGQWMISAESSGYTIHHCGSSGMIMAPNGDVLSNGVPVMIDAYSATNTARHWTLEQVNSPPSGVLAYDTSTGTEIEFGSRYLAVGTQRTLSELNFAAYAYSGNSSTTEKITWSCTSGSSHISINTNTGTITALSVGTALVTGHSQYGNVRLYVTVTGSAATDFVLINQYDSSFLDDPNDPIDGPDLVGFIDDAVSFVNEQYQKQFGVTFSSSTDPYYRTEAITDACTKGKYGSCHSDTACSGGCNASHHKNLYRISDHLYSSTIPQDHIVVFWTNRDFTSYCIDGKIVFGVLNAVYACVYQYRPVIHIMTIDGNTNEMEACMAINLAHEIAHTLGLEDQYTKDSHENGIWDCVMDNYGGTSGNENPLSFYNQVKNNELGLFCDSCAAQIAELLADNT